MAGDPRYQSGPVAPVEATECQHRHLRLADPRRLELRAKGYHQQYPQGAQPLNGEVEQLVRSRIDPMRVPENHQHRLPSGQTFELPDQRLQCLFLLALRGEVGQRMALGRRQGQQIDDECDIIVRRHRAGQHGFELLQPCRKWIVARKTRCPAE